LPKSYYVVEEVVKGVDRVQADVPVNVLEGSSVGVNVSWTACSWCTAEWCERVETACTFGVSNPNPNPNLTPSLTLP
jgi:hypothetical protein